MSVIFVEVYLGDFVNYRSNFVGLGGSAESSLLYFVSVMIRSFRSLIWGKKAICSSGFYVNVLVL